MKTITKMSKSELYQKYRESRKANNIQIWWDAQEGQDRNVCLDIINQSGKAEDRLRKYKNSPLFKFRIRKFVNMHGYSDVHPYEVVRVISDKCVEIRALDTKQTVFPKNFQIGGFAAHCVDNHNQKYEYTSNPQNPVGRIRLSKKGWGLGRYLMSDEPIKFYDYNF